jgi:hypothetical protein
MDMVAENFSVPRKREDSREPGFQEYREGSRISGSQENLLISFYPDIFPVFLYS